MSCCGDGDQGQGDDAELKLADDLMMGVMPPMIATVVVEVVMMMTVGKLRIKGERGWLSSSTSTGLVARRLPLRRCARAALLLAAARLCAAPPRAARCALCAADARARVASNALADAVQRLHYE